MKNASQRVENVVEKERAEKRANAFPALTITDLVKGDRTMAVESQYSDSARADNPEQTKNTWKSVGGLARDAVKKAARK